MNRVYLAKHGFCFVSSYFSLRYKMYICCHIVWLYKGLVIDHRERGGGGGVTKWENNGAETFCVLPQDRVKRDPSL